MLQNVEKSDADYLARAIRIAQRGRYTTHPNPQVGCVLVNENKVVGEGYHLRAGEGHAEVMALRNAGDAARGATAYVSLEPCSFDGRTPSCAKELVTSGVRRVVAAMLDPDPRNAGRGLAILQDAGIEVVTPMLEKSARALNPGHVKRHELGVPFVRLKLAMSLDGKTALATGESRWITGAAARRDVQALRARSSAIVTGVQTVIDDDPRMTVRAGELNDEHAELAGMIPKPVYILDSHCRIQADAKLLANPNTTLVCCAGSGVDVNDRELPVEILEVAPGADARVDLEHFLIALGHRECNEVLFECGATLAGALTANGLVDELIVYIAPVFMGADSRSLLNLKEIDKMVDLFQLQITDVRMVGSDIRVTAIPTK